MTDPNGLPSLLNEIIADLGNPALMWQLALIALCVAFAHWRARAAWKVWEPRIVANRSSQAWSEVQADALSRLLFPIIALASVGAVKLVLGFWFKTQLLNLALVLLVALALVRIIVYSVSRLSRSRALVAFERTLVVLVWLAVLLHVSGHWSEAVELLDSIHLSIGKQTISLWMLATGLFWTVLTVIAAVWLGGFIETRLLGNEAIDPSLGTMLARLIRALLLVAGLLLGLTLVGLDLTALSVFGGALGVGIGLGLQRIASNYISGFIVLLERRVHLGDIVRVDQFSGQVKEIRTRFTVLRSGEGVDQIVPNELLTAQAVQNYSTSGTSIVKLPLLIAYSADVALASQLALQSVQGVERVLEQPGASVFFRGWTIDGLLLELIFSISDPNKGSDPVRSEILRKIWLSWQAQGVPVPFMQRDFRPPVGQIVTSAPSANHALSTSVSGSDPSR